MPSLKWWAPAWKPEMTRNEPSARKRTAPSFISLATGNHACLIKSVLALIGINSGTRPRRRGDRRMSVYNGLERGEGSRITGEYRPPAISLTSILTMLSMVDPIACAFMSTATTPRRDGIAPKEARGSARRLETALSIWTSTPRSKSTSSR